MYKSLCVDKYYDNRNSKILPKLFTFCISFFIISTLNDFSFKLWQHYEEYSCIIANTNHETATNFFYRQDLSASWPFSSSRSQRFCSILKTNVDDAIICTLTYMYVYVHAWSRIQMTDTCCAVLSAARSTTLKGRHRTRGLSRLHVRCRPDSVFIERLRRHAKRFVIRRHQWLIV